MTTDYRALCIELTDCLEKADWPLRHRYVFRQWIDIARAALADEPAVPEGREPASVTTQPSDEGLLATLNQAVANFPPRHPEAEAMNAVEYPLALELRKARAVLARWGNPAPQPPAEGEVAELVAWLKENAEDERQMSNGDNPASLNLDRAADSLQRLSPPQPVPVSERLPGPSDVAPWPKDSDASAWCWLGREVDGGWEWEQRSAGYLVASSGIFTHWLSAYALPLPGQEVEG